MGAARREVITGLTALAMTPALPRVPVSDAPMRVIDVTEIAWDAQGQVVQMLGVPR